MFGNISMGADMLHCAITKWYCAALIDALALISTRCRR
jgi:hypothetical protein